MAVAHLIVDVSGHGYGHAAMTFPILNALRRIRPYLKLTIRCDQDENESSARGLRLRKAPDTEFSKQAVLREWDKESGQKGTRQH
jgi:hypothetical protein